MKHVFHVSPKGDDAATGSAARPFATIEHAILAARAAGRGARIVLEDGTYRLARTLKLGRADSGLAIEAAPGARPVLSGCRAITGWRKEKDGRWSASVLWVNSRAKAFRQFFVNGSERPRAVFPKAGFLNTAPDPRPEGVPWGEWAHNHPRDAVEILGESLDPSWDYSCGELVVYHYWVDTHLAPKAVRVADGKTVVELEYPCRRSPGDTVCRLENSRSIVTEPGEWALDWRKRRLYYLPRKGEDMASARTEAPCAAALLEIDGGEDITFRGVRFFGARYDLPWGERNDLQASFGVASAIVLRNARRCLLEGCAIENVDGYGVEMRDGTCDCTLSRCRLLHLGAGGVRLGCDARSWRGSQPENPLVDAAVRDPRIRVRGNEISDCEIGDYGRSFPSACGVFITDAEHTRIVHNEIHDGYYTGVSCGWVWGHMPSLSYHNEISFNHIHDIGKGLLSDMGGVYTLGVSTGTVVTNNVIHDIDARHYGGWGLYTDEGSSGIIMENNVVYRTKFACYHMHFGRECIIRNNVFGGGLLEQVVRSRRQAHISFFFYNNIVFWKEGALHKGNWDDPDDYEFPYHPDKSRKLRKTTECDWNLYFNPNLRRKDVRFGPDLTWEEWRARGEDVHSLWADPRFADPGAGDFSLSPDSPAFKLGFRPIDVSAVGIRKRPTVLSD